MKRFHFVMLGESKYKAHEKMLNRYSESWKVRTVMRFRLISVDCKIKKMTRVTSSASHAKTFLVL